MRTKTFFKFLALFSIFLTGLISCAHVTEDLAGIPERITATDTSFYDVPLAGNAFVTIKPSDANELITENGLANWTNKESVTSVYFRVQDSGSVSLKLRAKVAPANNSSKIKITVNGNAREIDLVGSDFEDYEIGHFTVPAGYVKVDIQGISKTGGYFGDVSHVLVGGVAQGNLLYADDPDYYYWARRGPSCHIGYNIPTQDPIQYYYGELTVPTGEDAIGSYFMSNGFSEGYFGIQVNAEAERRILFSVWSPHNTDNPADIPEHLRVKLNKKGADVQTGEFGNEGSGGQSFLRYNWVAGATYRFLLKGQPDGSGSTDYTAWIDLPEKGGWYLIASWKRPETDKNLSGFHSFLENFNPNNGHLGRKVLFTNRWVRTVSGTWLPIQSAKFTVDATYNAKQRIDAIGGVESNQFYLQNGGFFNTIVEPTSSFSIPSPQIAPVIDFDALP
ncbi:DUF3472 domain-containing protein [Sphingobacterium paludis]|uniref:Uncharacterized protein DUF5077 n=1 Tax=Sphingobacterium paludis TaxID=1476465 RepID=A0A4R7DAF6_9SPHI|nr:DUF3472 domain-containing protein [Sphingobacterium paludis]TDS16046.1 uncharacterized protein DUF5077 [Sphingobacterium paludis]